MNPLYKIANDYCAAYDDLLSIPELSQEIIADTMASLAGDLESKAINVAAFIKNMESEAEAIKKAESEMQKRRRSLENKTNNLKKYLIFNLNQCRIKEIKTSPYFLIKLKENPPSVVIDNENEIPKDFRKVEIIENIDKIAISKALKNGDLVPGAHLENKLSISIK